MTDAYDVVVAGGGNAGLCAAVAAAESGARVLLAEKAPRERRGGNSRFAALYRFPYNGVDDLVMLCPRLLEWRDRADIPPYDEARFHADLLRCSGPGTDEVLIEAVSSSSRQTVQWLHEIGVRWEVSDEGAVVLDGRYSWQDGYVIRPRGGIRGVLDTLYSVFEELGGEVRYDCSVSGLDIGADGVCGVCLSTPDASVRTPARAVVLAAGGFEASAERRARHLGQKWAGVKVRGTRSNTGECLDFALAAGAAPAGGWAYCHATMVHASAPPYEMGERAFPHAYPYGLLLNSRGKRFTDEAPSSFAFTYAGMGERVLDQPGGVAYQLFDAKSAPLRKVALYGAAAYDVPHSRASSVREVARLAGLDPRAVGETVEEFNFAVDETIPYDPLRLDGRHTTGLAIEKSNWADRVDTPPFQLYPVECGITFTFGGLHITQQAEVLRRDRSVLVGLYACGEMSGVFQRGYPGGSGLMAGAVFGRRAGMGAAARSAA